MMRADAGGALAALALSLCAATAAPAPAPAATTDADRGATYAARTDETDLDSARSICSAGGPPGGQHLASSPTRSVRAAASPRHYAPRSPGGINIADPRWFERRDPSGKPPFPAFHACGERVYYHQRGRTAPAALPP